MASFSKHFQYAASVDNDNDSDQVPQTRTGGQPGQVSQAHGPKELDKAPDSNDSGVSYGSGSDIADSDYNIVQPAPPAAKAITLRQMLCTHGDATRRRPFLVPWLKCRTHPSLELTISRIPLRRNLAATEMCNVKAVTERLCHEVNSLCGMKA
jgi:hypothetical protein